MRLPPALSCHLRRREVCWKVPAKLMVFKLLCAAPKTWWRLKGINQLPKVFVHGCSSRVHSYPHCRAGCVRDAIGSSPFIQDAEFLKMLRMFEAAVNRFNDRFSDVVRYPWPAPAPAVPFAV